MAEWTRKEGLIMWDYDKLFAVGNFFCCKTKEIGDIWGNFVRPSNKEMYISLFNSQTLENKNDAVQYIIQLNEHGDVVEKLFDRDRDIKEPMPDLENGYFVDVNTRNGGLGIILEKFVTYQNGESARLEDIKSKIIKVWSNEIVGFNECKTEDPIWERK